MSGVVFKGGKLKLGKNKVTVDKEESDIKTRQVSFIVPKTGTYKFTIENLVSDETDVPSASLNICFANREHRMKLDGKAYWMIMLHTENLPDLLAENGSSYENFLKNTSTDGYAFMASATFKLKLKKGYKLVVWSYNIREHKARDLNGTGERSFDVTYDLTIKRVK